MNIVRRVTADAGCRRVTMLGFRLMATAARKSLVCSLEGEIGQSVIESLRCQPHDIGAAAFVISVAIPALPASRRLEPAVEPHFGADVARYLDMAIQTQAALPVGFERCVALAALLFDFPVTVDHGSRHHQMLPVHGGCCKRRHASRNPGCGDRDEPGLVGRCRTHAMTKRNAPQIRGTVPSGSS